jgi:hypothetical protein
VSPLGERAAELMRAGREAGRATEGDCTRILAALSARLNGSRIGWAEAQARRQATGALWPRGSVVMASLGIGGALEDP